MAKRGNGRSPKSQPDWLLVAHVSDLEQVDGVIYPPVGHTYLGLDTLPATTTALPLHLFPLL